MTSADAVLERFVAAVESERLGLYGVHIRVGEETAWHRWRSDDRENLYSVSKDVCAIATGMAIDEGLISLDLKAGEVFADFPLGDGVEQVTLRHLLTMSSGIDFLWFGHEPVLWPDLAAETLSRPTTGRRFQYSDVSTYVAMRVRPLGTAERLRHRRGHKQRRPGPATSSRLVERRKVPGLKQMASGVESAAPFPAIEPRQLQD